MSRCASENCRKQAPLRLRYISLREAVVLGCSVFAFAALCMDGERHSDRRGHIAYLQRKKNRSTLNYKDS